jgi:hypothetical protein
MPTSPPRPRASAPLLVGFAVGALLRWRDRRRQVSDIVAAAGSR